jgi:RecB family exonuclease
MRLDALPEPLSGLDALGRGSLYHLALETLLAPFVGKSPPEIDELTARLPGALDEAAAALEQAGEIDLGPLWAAERRDHLTLLERAVRSPDFLPAHHQVSALEQELSGQVLVDGQPWTFRGYADRVDLTASGEQVVTDYKLSRYISHVRDEAGQLSTEVQLPLYLALTGASTGRYYSLNDAKVLASTGPGALDTKIPWMVKQAQVQGFLGQVRADLLAGDFRALPDPQAQACRYCSAQPVCRFQVFTAQEAG